MLWIVLMELIRLWFESLLRHISKRIWLFRRAWCLITLFSLFYEICLFRSRHEKIEQYAEVVNLWALITQTDNTTGSQAAGQSSGLNQDGFLMEYTWACENATLKTIQARTHQAVPDSLPAKQ